MIKIYIIFLLSYCAYPFIFDVDNREYVCTLSCDEPFVVNQELCKCEHNKECNLVCDEPLKINKQRCYCECPLQLTGCPEDYYLSKEFCECIEFPK